MILSYVDNYEDFEYEVFDKEVVSALAEIVYDNLSDLYKNKETRGQNVLLIEEIIETFDLQEELEDRCKDDLHDYFKDAALESHIENKERHLNPFRDTGLSESDFIGG